MEGVLKRKAYIDILRVIATVFVICGHTVSLASSMITQGSTAFYVLEILHYTSWSCNLIFVMISGALLLPVRGEKPGYFFCRRVSKVVVPLVIYYILYVCAKGGLVWLRPDHWWRMALRILTGPPEEAPHFWLIYVILWLYVLTPLLRWIVQHIPDHVLAGVIGVIFVINTLDAYLPLFGLNLHLSVIVDSFAGIFLFGYFLAEKCNPKIERLILAGGVISYVISCILVVKLPFYEDYIYHNAPTMMLFAAAIFLLVQRAATNRQSVSAFTALVGKYSFSILLIHWGVLHFVVKQMLHVDVLSGGIVGGCLLMAVLTFFLSLAGAVVIENVLVRPVQRLILGRA